MLQVSLGRYLVQGRMLLVNVGTSTYPLLTHDMLLASNISHCHKSQIYYLIF